MNLRFRSKLDTRRQNFGSGIWYLLSTVLLSAFIFGFTDGLLAQAPPKSPPPGGPPGGPPGEQQMKVEEYDLDGKAAKISFLNVVNANIQDILKFMSDATNLTIIASERVQGKVTLVNLKAVTVDEALEALKTALNTLGFTMVRVNKTIVVTPVSEAKARPVRVQQGSDPNMIESSDEIITQIMPLSTADASGLSQTLRNIISKDADIFADTTTNSLVITDTSSNIRRIATIVKQLDVEPAGVLKTKIIQLKYANATSLAQILSALFQQGVETARTFQKLSQRGPEEMMKFMEKAQQGGKMPGKGIDVVKGQVLIIPDDRTNKLIISASEENLEIISKLIEELDTGEVAQAEIKVFLLDYALAENVATELETLLQGTGGRNLPPWERWRSRELQTRAKGIQGDVNITFDERLNAVIVSSDPQNFSFIENLIKQLDQQIEPQEVIKIFPLKYADAESVVENLKDLFEGAEDEDMPYWERSWMRMRRMEMGAKEEVTAIQGKVNLVADTRLNAIVVSTATANIPILTDLISKLDITIPDLETDTKIFPLRYADAESLAEILGNIYQQGRSRGQDPFRFFWMPRTQERRNTGVLTGAITVEAYTRTNSLIVTTSSARNFDVVERLLEQLDQPTPSDYKYSTLIYPLEYSDAEEMQQILNDIFSEEGAGGPSTRRGGGQQNFFRMMMTGRTPVPRDMTTLVGQVRVNADAQTNSLIITTPERNFEAVKEIIRQLDIVRGQVWLDIKVLEVSLGEDNKLGLEWIWEEGKHLGKKGWTGVFGTDFQLSDEYLGFTYEVFNKNLTALLHTLMKENKVEVRSLPSVLTRDNQAATLSRGKDIPYLQSARTDQFGQIIYDYDFLQDIGINVQITPHIAKTRAIKEELLFSVDPKFQSDLNNGKISMDLRKEFEKNGITLSDDSSITMKEDDKWRIIDKKRMYLVKKSEDRLDIYRQEEKRTIGLDITRVNVSSFLEYTEFNAPVTSDSTVTTYVDVEDGDQIAIGGMIKSETKKVVHAIPILGSIPFLGRLFKKTEDITEDTQLWILIRPHIVDIHLPEDREMLRKLQSEQVSYEDVKLDQPKVGTKK